VWVFVVAAVVVVAGGLGGAAAAGVFRGAPGAGAPGNADKTSVARVLRGSLSAQTNVSATLEDRGSYTIVNGAAGTLTRLPAVGRVVRRGGVLYRVDGAPVALLYGTSPAYRALSVGMTGAAVRELNENLIALGYTTRYDLLAPGLGLGYYSAATKAAVADWQQALGIADPTGKLGLGQAVFEPSAVKVTGLETGVTLGAAATPGESLLTATSTSPYVTISLDADQQTEVKAGDHVAVTLPDGSVTPGVVSSVGTVATTNSSGTTTVTVNVALTDPKAAGSLDKAPVTVSVTSASVSDVLYVPVDALEAEPGGYAVEVIGPHGQHHLVKVTTGLFDDAAGDVQVSGPGLSAGQRIVVPAI
jgi:peptidoglycan hydrolase-like protein with peptidoglycan-binding domain